MIKILVVVFLAIFTWAVPADAQTADVRECSSHLSCETQKVGKATSPQDKYTRSLDRMCHKANFLCRAQLKTARLYSEQIDPAQRQQLLSTIQLKITKLRNRIAKMTEAGKKHRVQPDDDKISQIETELNRIEAGLN